MEKRVKARHINRRLVLGDYVDTISVRGGAEFPDEFEIVWDDPDVHQCPGLWPCVIKYNPASMAWNMYDSATTVVFRLFRCPCCDWEPESC